MILSCQSHVLTVDYTNVEVMAGGNSENGEKSAFLKIGVEKIVTFLKNKKVVFEAASHFYSTSVSVFRVYLLLSFTQEQ